MCRVTKRVVDRVSKRKDGVRKEIGWSKIREITLIPTVSCTTTDISQKGVLSHVLSVSYPLSD